MKYSNIIIRSNISIKEKDLNMQYKPYKYKVNKNIDENLDSPTSPNSICQNNSNFNSDTKS